MIIVYEITVVQGLQAEVGEVQITLWFHRSGDFIQVVLCQAAINQFQFCGFLDVTFKLAGVLAGHVFLCRNVGIEGQETEGFASQDIE